MQESQTRTVAPPIVVGLRREQLDGVPWAMTKVDRGGRFTYGNRAMCTILGRSSIEGLTIEDVFRGEHLATVRAHLDSRFTRGTSDEYEVEAVRPDDGVRVPLRCSAMPDIDDSGHVVGAIAIVRDLLAEDTFAKCQEALQELRDGPAILAAVARECRRIVAFDFFGVTLYSVDGDHARQFFVAPEQPVRPSARWYEMSDYAKALVAEKRVINVPDFEQWLELPQWRQYRDDPDTQVALKMGMRSSLSFPVVVGNRVVATVGFVRLRDKPAFQQREEDQLGRLPLRAAVRMALHYQEVGELEFALGLMRRIAGGPATSDFIADTLIEAMARHYDWANVSIFRPDERTGELCLVRQHAANESFRLPADWRHPIDQGVTGRVYRTGQAMNIPDVRAPGVRDLYLAGLGESRSELCLPIVVGGRVYWVLNLEDTKRNAFANEEQASLAGMLREVAVMLELVTQTQVFTELLQRSRDAVIQTDYRGIVVQVNPATEELLGYGAGELVGTPLADYFQDREQARRVEESSYVPNDEVHLLRKDGTGISLLLSGTSLPPEIGRKVYVCNDLSTRKRLETIEILRQMYNEIASQIKTPLSLAFTWLDRLNESGLPPRGADLVDKTVKQLRKVDLSFDRLLFYERHRSIAPVERIVFEIPAVVDRLREELPDSEAAQLEVVVADGVPPVRGDLAQIWFCLESLVAYLLRFVPADGVVRVQVAPCDGRVEIRIAGRAPHVTGGVAVRYTVTRWAIRAITELALGEQMIRGFIVDQNGGSFHKVHGEDDRLEFTITLPGALAEVAA